MRSSEKLYRFHVENLRTIDTALQRVTRSLRDAISRSDDETTFAFVRLYALMLGAWAECRLSKLLYEPNAFNESERHCIRERSTQFDRWSVTVEIAFRKHYHVPRATLSESTLSHSVYARYSSLVKMLNEDLLPTIQLRNKLAHGQWRYPLNSEGDDVAQEQMDVLRNENLLSLQFKRKLLNYLSDVIHDLVVSRPTFERDFDDHYRAIVQTRQNLRNRSFSSYIQKMRGKYKRGQEKRRRTAYGTD
ncbi:MAG: hypothetical protein ACE5JU_18870 [Candidatus Binatia bacterium]